jgi:hypothetical protein
LLGEPRQGSRKQNAYESDDPHGSHTHLHHNMTPCTARHRNARKLEQQCLGAGGWRIGRLEEADDALSFRRRDQAHPSVRNSGGEFGQDSVIQQKRRECSHWAVTRTAESALVCGILMVIVVSGRIMTVVFCLAHQLMIETAVAQCKC